VLERALACSAEHAFALLTEPQRMNRWSSARIEARAPGDGQHAAGVGALRRVYLPAPMRGVLDEVVEQSEPPTRFVYRVIGGAPVRDHRGDITIEAVPGGSRLRWEVRAQPLVPGSGALMRRMLRTGLEQSLDALVRVAGEAAAGAAEVEDLPPKRAPWRAADLEALEQRALACRDEQRALADELAGSGDGKYWFTRVYQHVTDLQIDSCRAGAYQHPGWVLALVERFHVLYLHNLERDLGRRDGWVENHWKEAFDHMRRDVRAAQRRSGQRRFEQMARCVFRGMKAHIEDDLPRALAQVYAARYAERCDYPRFRSDYLTMGPIFRDAGDRLLAELDPREVPLQSRVLGAVLPAEAKDRLMARRMYDIPRQRSKAFERGGRIAAMLVDDKRG
jgi:uncharacterized protein YndB with AHSA1/START domain